jgi:alkaline phosphatase D
VKNDQAGRRDIPKDPARFAAGYQAFLDYMPVELDLIYEPGRTLPSVESYRSYQFGDLLEVFVLDQRQYRMANPCLTTYFSPGCAAMHDPELSMLGVPQRQWLKESLGASRATWKFLANEVMLSPVRFGDRYLNLDQWDGYPVEKEDILSFLDQEEIGNVVAITGDIHAAVNGYLYREGRDSGRASALEVVTASISTTSLGEVLGNVLGPAAHSLLHRTNRHLAWSDIVRHGYTVLDVSEEGLDVRHVAVDTIALPTSGASLARRVKVAAGKPEFLA